MEHWGSTHKYQVSITTLYSRQSSIRLSMFMFNGTPCSCIIVQLIQDLCLFLVKIRPLSIPDKAAHPGNADLNRYEIEKCKFIYEWFGWSATFGQFTVGRFTFGQFTVGLFTFGQLTVGLFTFGLYTFGLYTFGQFTFDRILFWFIQIWST